ncbi:MAG: HD domain-containing protein [Deltaproteobacteria bacterium]|nr:HD domain-containing protein [Deltaproteobacteria bacterium]
MLKIQDILRAQDIKRWTIVRTVRQQSLAEHTFNVVMVARAIARKASLSDESIIKYALEHDLDEILTGDIPSPTKKRMRKAGIDLLKIESRGKNVPISMTMCVVKAADLIENLWFLREHGVGRHAKEECKLLESIVHDYIISCPRTIAEAATYTLDALLSGEFFRYE